MHDHECSCQVIKNFSLHVHVQDLSCLQVLDLSHNKVNSLSALHFRIGNVAKISLAYNEITSLNGKHMNHFPL